MEINNTYGSYVNAASGSYDTAGGAEAVLKAYRSTDEYRKALQEKFSYMNRSTTMEGVPTTVSVSPAFLEKCAQDPEKAKYLEENLAALPNCAKMAVAGCMGTLTYIGYSVDANGNITAVTSGTSDPDGKIAKENAERKAKEQKEAEKKRAKRRAERKAEEKWAAERRAKKQAEQYGEEAFTVSAGGADVRSITKNLITASWNAFAAAGASFDIRA